MCNDILCLTYIFVSTDYKWLADDDQSTKRTYDKFEVF